MGLSEHRVTSVMPSKWPTRANMFTNHQKIRALYSWTDPHIFSHIEAAYYQV